MNSDPDDRRSTDPWGDEMTTEFDRRVRDLHEAPLSLEQVKGRATTIRRKRRAAVAGAVLAAAAVVVPVAVVAGNALGEDRADIAPATSSPTATDPATPDPRPADLSVAYVEGTSFHRSDGSVYELPKATYEKAATVGDRVVAYFRPVDDGTGPVPTPGTVDVIEDGEVVASYQTDNPFVSSASGGTIALVTTDGEVLTVWDDGERALGDGYAGWMPTAVDGGPDCAEPGAGDDGCRVFLNDQMSGAPPVAVDAQGSAGLPVPGAVRISDTDGQGRLSVLSSVSDDGSCGAVYDETASDYVFAPACEFALGAFSPDSRHLLANDAYADGIGPGFVVAVDATTGEEVARLEPANGYVSRQAWVDDDTLAGLVFDFSTQTWSLQTLTLGEDAPRTVLGPTPGTDVDPPYRLTD